MGKETKTLYQRLMCEHETCPSHLKHARRRKFILLEAAKRIEELEKDNQLRKWLEQQGAEEEQNTYAEYLEENPNATDNLRRFCQFSQSTQVMMLCDSEDTINAKTDQVNKITAGVLVGDFKLATDQLHLQHSREVERLQRRVFCLENENRRLGK